MEREKQQFWTAVILGFLVMILVAILNVNTLGLIPVLGPLAGGIIAGFFAGKGYADGAKAGLTSGIFGMIAVLIDFILKTGYLRAAIPQVAQVLGVAFLLLAMIIYFPILAYIGGAIGGAISRFSKTKRKSTQNPF